MVKALIVAVDKNFGIGKLGRLPWSLKKEMAYFKKHTIGKSVIMGKNTMISIPIRKWPLKRRQNLILSSTINISTNTSCYNVRIVKNIGDALKKASFEPIFMGGEEVYRDALKLGIDKIYLSIIDHEFDCDKFFPYGELKNYKLEKQSQQVDFCRNTQKKVKINNLVLTKINSDDEDVDLSSYWWESTPEYIFNKMK